MRFGYCANINFLLTGDETSRIVFDSVLKSGFDYIELQLSTMLKLSVDQYAGLKNRLQDAGTPCRANFLLFPHEMPLTGEALNLAAIAEHAKRVLPIARELGSEVVVFGNGGSRKVKDGLTREGVWQNLADILRAVAPIAQDVGVRVAVEPLCSLETNMINTYQEGAALAREAGSPMVGTVCDLYHVVSDKQDIAAMASDPEKLFHLHIAYPAGRKIPSMADDRADYAAFMAAARAARYDGTLSIEVGNPGDPARIPAAIAEGLAVLKSL